MENVSEATATLNPIEKQEFLLAALSQAAKLTFQYGDGHDIMLGSAYGLCRLAYQLIENPAFDFEYFYALLFPNEFLNSKGFDTFTEMIQVAYADQDNPFGDSELLNGDGSTKVVAEHSELSVLPDSDDSLAVDEGQVLK